MIPVPTKQIPGPWRQPMLTTYGSLRELTREVSCNTNKDGGSNAVCRRT
jgi:hypothetical protein